MDAIVPALGAALLAAMQPPGPAEGEAPPPAAAEPASTAVALRDVDNRMTVKVMIGGAGPFRFIVDSGATRTVISRDLARLLALPAAGRVLLHSVGGAREVDTVSLTGMTLGDLPARAIVAPVLDGQDLGAAGILGIDALAGRAVVLDMRTRTMTVKPAARTRARSSMAEIVVVARRRFGQLVLADADAAGQRIFAVVDTGSMVTIGNGALRERLVRRRRAAPVQTVITDVTGQRIVASSAPVTTIRLGPWRLGGLSIAFSDAHAFARFGLAGKPAMLLGMDVMRAFDRVSIDFRQRTVQLLRPGGSDGARPFVRIAGANVAGASEGCGLRTCKRTCRDAQRSGLSGILS